MKVSNILGSLGIFKPQDQVERERQAAAAGGILTAWNEAQQSVLSAQQLQDAMNSAMYHGNDASKYANAQQGGWAAANQPQQGWQADPVDLLIKNPFQANALYVRLRMTRVELKAKDIEFAFVRQMGGSVHVAIVNQDRVLTMIDEDVGAFPSDAFIARIRLLL